MPHKSSKSIPKPSSVFALVHMKTQRIVLTTSRSIISVQKLNEVLTKSGSGYVWILVDEVPPDFKPLVPK